MSLSFLNRYFTVFDYFFFYSLFECKWCQIQRTTIDTWSLIFWFNHFLNYRFKPDLLKVFTVANQIIFYFFIIKFIRFFDFLLTLVLAPVAGNEHWKFILILFPWKAEHIVAIGISLCSWSCQTHVWAWHIIHPVLFENTKGSTV